MDEKLNWHGDASIDLSVLLPAEGGLPSHGKPESNSFHGVHLAFREGFVYIRVAPESGGNRVFVVPASAVVRAELPNGAWELS